jgi:hypothetical protein
MKTIIVIVSLLLIVNVAAGAPVVTAYSGTISNGNSITLYGTDFGANGPYVVLFDDYEGGTAGQPESMNIATMGAPYNYSSDLAHSQNTNTYRVSGNLGVIWDNNYTNQTNNPCIIKFAPMTFDTFYMSWWQMRPVGDNFSGSTGGGGNWKTMWIMSWNGTDKEVTSSLGNVTISAGSDTGWQVFGNGYPCTHSVNYTTVPGRWTRFQFYNRGRTDSTGLSWVATTDNTNHTVVRDNTTCQTLPSGAANTRGSLSINAFTRPTSPPSHQAYDDVYWAIGENAFARVEIGDASTYTACNKLAVCTTGSGAVGWSDTSITCTVRQGGFANGSNAWIYVSDANGNVSPGHPVTISGTQSSSAPNAPSIGVQIVR